MKRLSIIILPLAALTFLSSCMKDLTIERPAAEISAIRIRPAMNILSKAPLAGTTFPTTRSLVMSAYHNAPSGGTSENLFSGVSFTYSDGHWKGDKFWPADGSLDLFAYSADGLDVTPSYKSNVGQGVTLTVPDNSTVQTDILWGYNAGVTSEGGAAAITMRHAEAAIGFVAKAATAYDAVNNLGITITGITVSNVNCAGTAALGNSETCSWSGLGTKKTLTLPGLSSGYNVPATAMTISDSNPFGIGGTGLIVIPQAATSVTVTYTAHNGRKSDGTAIDAAGQTVTVTLSGNWSAGKKYVYTLDFTNSVSLTTNVYEWTSASSRKTVSATYSVVDGTEVLLPAATLSAGTVISIDWGDGFCETLRAPSSVRKAFTHTYTSEYVGIVNIIVHNGTVDFGKVVPYYFERFTVNEGTKVLLTEKQIISFSVNDSGKEVLFAQGNLYWDGEKFNFEEHQYDYPTGWDASHVGYFYWDKDASIAIADDYIDNSASTSDTFFAADGGAVEGWTVLSNDEWQYVIDNHLGKNVVSIDGTNCTVLVPDGVDASVVHNSYTAAQWTQAEQDYGLVALPFAGGRVGTSLYDDGSCGNCWSATPNSDFRGSAYNAYFDSSNAYCVDYFGRDNGFPVRLVSVQYHPEVFTVDGSGKKVKFAPGNLFWDGSSFKFEEHDCDYPTSWSSSHVGHFFWSKDARVAYAANYNNANTEFGITPATTDKFFAAEGGAIEGWTVLSKDEWDYVINNHMGKYRVSIAGKNCTVLVPDGVAASVVQSSYTAAQWADAKKQHGLVALPSAGYYDGSGISYAGSFGDYWSCNPVSSAADKAYGAIYDTDDAHTLDDQRDGGASVRLVSVQ